MTPLGLGADTFWGKLAGGESGVAPVQLPEHHGIGSPGSVGGEVSDFTESAARKAQLKVLRKMVKVCLLYTSPSPRDQRGSRMPSSA